MINYNFTGHVIRTGQESCHVEIQVELNYDAENDPLAVEMVLSDDEMDHPVTWHFARDLLVRATNSPFSTGSGDVRFRTDNNGADLLYVCIRNPQTVEHADLAFPASTVRAFLAATTEEAAQCLATLDSAVDAFIAEVLG